MTSNQWNLFKNALFMGAILLLVCIPCLIAIISKGLVTPIGITCALTMLGTTAGVSIDLYSRWAANQ